MTLSALAGTIVTTHHTNREITMKANDAWRRTESDFALSRKQVLERIELQTSFGLGHIIFMSHQLTSQVQDELRGDGYKIRRVPRETHKIEVSWEG